MVLTSLWTTVWTAFSDMYVIMCDVTGHDMTYCDVSLPTLAATETALLHVHALHLRSLECSVLDEAGQGVL